MNEVIKAMKERRSIRKFKAEMPPKADLEQIVEAGLYAANGRGKQAVITIAVTDKELRDKLSAVNNEIMGGPEGNDPFYGAPAILIVLANKEVPTAPYDGQSCYGQSDACSTFSWSWKHLDPQSERRVWKCRNIRSF